MLKGLIMMSGQLKFGGIEVFFSHLANQNKENRLAVNL